MSDVLYVASRKGLFAFTRGPQGWRAGPPAFLGEPVTMTLPDRRDGRLYAALRLGHFGPKLHRSDDGGATWTAVTPPAFAKADGEADAPSVDMIWALAAGGADEPGAIWAGTIPGAVFRSDDRGESWRLMDALWSRPERKEWLGGGYDHPGVHSIAVDPRDSAKLTIAISCGGVWKSEDRGASWRLAGKGLRAAFMPPDKQYYQNIQDIHRLAMCRSAPDVMWGQHHNGIFLSRDAGETFVEFEGVKPSVFGFAVAAHPGNPDTAWFVPGVKDECRVPVDARLVVTRTKNGGKSFEALGKGLPEPSYDLVYRHALDVDETGTRLAMGSTTGGLWVSEDGGESWTLVSAHLPPIAAVAFG